MSCNINNNNNNSNNNNFIYCPQCGSKGAIVFIDKYWKCNNCPFILYHNPASTAAVIISDEENNILFIIRAREPKKGLLDCPGGFTDSDETDEQNAIRECKEEIGIEPLNLKYLCSCPNDYFYKGFNYKTCDVYFTGQLPIGIKFKDITKFDESEVKGICFKKIEKQDDIDKLPLAFSSLKIALEIWLKKYGK